MILEKLRTHVASLCAAILPTMFAINANAQCVQSGTCFDVVIETSNFRLENLTPNNSGTNTQAHIIFDYNITLVFKGNNTLTNNSCGYNGSFYTLQGYIQLPGNNATGTKIRTIDGESFFPNTTNQTAPFNIEMKSNVGSSKSGTVKSARFTYYSYRPDTVNVSNLASTIKWVVNGPGVNNTFFCDINPTNPLPIELVEFKPECGTVSNLINWSTASEQNNEKFNIYKSVDALNWDLLETVKGQGNSNTLQTYQIEDFSYSSDLVYYKLEQIDYSGRATAFMPAAIQCEEKAKQDKTINIFPNPINANTYIRASETISSLSLFDISGRKMFAQSDINSKEVQLKNVEEMPSGIYIVEIRFDDNTQMVQKIVK